MLHYPAQATTLKSISRFTYRLYESMGINMLKYNNDSSAAIRILNSLVRTSNCLEFDVPYQGTMSLENIDFTAIDRLNAFSLASIPNLNMEAFDGILSTNYLLGYSRYTRKSYLMRQVQDSDEFTRHSLPCDAFVAGALQTVGAPKYAVLYPHIKNDIKLSVQLSSVTIRVLAGVSERTRLSDEPVVLTILGKSISGDIVSEEIRIVNTADIVTRREYSFIDKIIVDNSSTSMEIQVYPYVLGDMVEWDETFVDREEFDSYKAYLTVSKESKKLVILAENDNGVDYPVKLEPVRLIDLKLNTKSEEITEYYIDVQNKLLYVLTDGFEGFYIFPLVVPSTPINTLDNLKTPYQAISVQYVNDSINRRFIFHVFPTEKVSGVEILNVSVDGEYIVENMILDMYIQSIETNKIEVPYDVLFKNGKETNIVLFSTVGRSTSTVGIYTDNTALKPLVEKDTSKLNMAWETPLIGSSWTTPYQKSYTRNYIPLPAELNADMLYKLSSRGSVSIGNANIILVFNSFYFEDNTASVTTSDTITHIGASDEADIPLDTFDEFGTLAIAGFAVAGEAEVVA